MPKSNLLFLGVTFMVGGHAEMTHLTPNPKGCSKCHIMPKSNFLFFGCDVHGVGYAEMTHPNPNPEYHIMPKSNFLFLGATFMVGGMLK